MNQIYEINVLGSSSSGNCILLTINDMNILLDAGFSYKRINEFLLSKHLTFNDISYIFLTHEHIDHIRGMNMIIKKHGIPIVGSRGTLSKLNYCAKSIYIKSGESVNLGKFIVVAHDINHDALEPLCYSLIFPDFKLLYLTDCAMSKYFRYNNYNVYIVECNYDIKRLEDNLIKNNIHFVQYTRALSGMGHHELEDCKSFLNNNIGANTELILLSHLSSQNADPIYFKNYMIDSLFFKDIYIAENGLTINKTKGGINVG